MRIFDRDGRIIDAVPGFGMPLPGSYSKVAPGALSGSLAVFNGGNRRPTGHPLPLREIGAATRIAHGVPDFFGSGPRARGQGPSIPFVSHL